MESVIAKAGAGMLGVSLFFRVTGGAKSGKLSLMKGLDRITFNPAVMGGRPCLRGMRVTVGTIVGLIASDRDRAEILSLYPYLDDEDISQALRYAAWRAEESDLPLSTASSE
jgi:uncharacterized protein (DUF433 family)